MPTQLQKVQNKSTKDNSNYYSKDSKNVEADSVMSLYKSQDSKQTKTERIADGLFTVSRYQRTGGGYNKSMLLHII